MGIGQSGHSCGSIVVWTRLRKSKAASRRRQIVLGAIAAAGITVIALPMLRRH